MFQLLLLLLVILLKGNRALYYLQLKEYRFDRLYDFFKYDSGFKIILTPFGLFAYFGFLLSSFTPSTPLIFYLSLTSAYLDILYLNLFRARLRFKPTFKAIQIFGLFSITTALISINAQLATAYLLAPFVLLFLVILFTPITKILKERKIRQAKKKLAQFPDLKIIAITGSYGKSSTKEFLSEILATKFKVLKTPKNINTDIGIANLVLSKLDATHQVFVVEMGAYRIGEIANSSKMMQVDYSILTAIAEQHLTLFGSLENIKTAKSEIANSLKPDGKLYLNIDSKGVQESLPNFKAKTVTYGTNASANLQVSKVIQSADFLTFTLNQENYKAPIFAQHNAVNLSVCIAIAKEFGLSEAEIQSALFAIKNPEANLSRVIGYKNCTIFNDSYNANLDGFLSAISLIANSKSKGPKILITMGLIELGEKSPQAHQQVAQAADAVFDYIIITKPNIYQYFSDCKKAKTMLLANPNSIINKFSDIITPDTIVLIENRVNPKVSNFLFSKN